MSGIYYLLSIVAILVIIRWFMRNDGRTETSGLLAMKSPGEDNHGTAIDE